MEKKETLIIGVLILMLMITLLTLFMPHIYNERDVTLECATYTYDGFTVKSGDMVLNNVDSITITDGVTVAHIQTDTMEFAYCIICGVIFCFDCIVMFAVATD